MNGLSISLKLFRLYAFTEDLLAAWSTLNSAESANMTLAAIVTWLFLEQRCWVVFIDI